jgi:hypothetical protein
MQVHIKVMGATFSKVDGAKVPFDSYDLRQPSIENGALFITTKIETVKQTRKECDNPEYVVSNGDEIPILAYSKLCSHSPL